MAAGDIRKLVIRPALKPSSDINVTPLVDVVLVLLIIFMVVTPLIEKDIEVRVPKTEQVEDMTEVPRDQLVVSLNPEGDVFINAEKIADADYVNKLRRILAAKTAGDRLVFFMADEKTNYSKVVHALDGAKQAGAEVLGMMTEIPPGMAPGGQPSEGAPGSPPTTPPAPGGAPPPGSPPSSPPG